jgi:hypothetical protein
MNGIVYKLVATVILLMPAAAFAQSAQRGTPSQSGEPQYIVFIHSGPKKADDPVVRQIAGFLVRAGYVVRSPDDAQDLVGGPGVDYFADPALPVAQTVANTINELLPKLVGTALDDSKKLKPRKQQNVKNPATYLGVWLF